MSDLRSAVAADDQKVKQGDACLFTSSKLYLQNPSGTFASGSRDHVLILCHSENFAHGYGGKFGVMKDRQDKVSPITRHQYVCEQELTEFLLECLWC